MSTTLQPVEVIKPAPAEGRGESAQVEKLSTQNGPTESRTYEFNLSEFVRAEGGHVQLSLPPPGRSSPELEAAIFAEADRLERQLQGRAAESEVTSEGAGDGVP